MNEKKSLKLHKSHKIVCFIVCFVIVFTILSVTCFAFDLSQGLYTPLNERVTGIDTNDAPLVYNIAGLVNDDDGEVYEFNHLILYYFSTYDLFNFIAVNNLEDFESGTDEGVVIAGYSGTSTIPARAFTIYSVEVVDSLLYDWLSLNFEFPDVPIYDGNPWIDILNGVMEALDVNIFGTFSYLDIVSTLAGACLAIWLLKMLAGG